MKRVGVIGGGQLAWMMGLEAPDLGLEIVVQTPQTSDPAVVTAVDAVLGAIADAQVTQRLSDRCDVITFENEFVDLVALRPLAQAGKLFRPQLSALEPLLDKLTQRQFLAAHGLPNPPYVAVDETIRPDELAAIAAKAVGFPLVMKTRRLGYDGQGTFVIHAAADLTKTWLAIERQPVLLEAFIPFEKELAVMVARSVTGEVVVYPVVETQQVEQICRRVIAPAEVTAPVQRQVEAIARTLIKKLAFVGVLGIELFLAPGDTVTVNEVAPRTHNSGHYTLDACQTSQFAQQLLAVTGQSLRSSALTCDRALMVNLLGYEHATHDYADVRSQLAAIPNAHVYWYGKSAARPGRKLGHITVTFSAQEDWPAIAQHIETLWYPPDNKA